jgi:serine/threonine protein kinase
MKWSEIRETPCRRYNFAYSELKFRILVYPKETREHEFQICYHTHADKWIILKNYFKYYTNIEFMIHELIFLHTFVGQSFIPKFYGWGSIEHIMRSSYGICFEVMDMNLRQFSRHFINNFGYEAFKHALPEGILGYISCVVLNALFEIHRKGFALRNINSNNILLNDRGEIKLCGFTYARNYEANNEWTSCSYNAYRSLIIGSRNFKQHKLCYSPHLPDGWSYTATLIEFACGDQPSCFKVRFLFVGLINCLFFIDKKFRNYMAFFLEKSYPQKKKLS